MAKRNITNLAQEFVCVKSHGFMAGWKTISVDLAMCLPYFRDVRNRVSEIVLVLWLAE